MPLFGPMVCPETGEQYVGSAYGEDGFAGRWIAYANDGHGGNKLLRSRNRTNYAVSVLEVASTEDTNSTALLRPTQSSISLKIRRSFPRQHPTSLNDLKILIYA
ncbi:hypothetical protein RUA4292_00709 [Ruegeria atlantica]|uniref:GIY-YIG domain-containing protein n=1 Tax=Ruegeria atlantica TaxID=81569 RepID=A0A0P1EBD9_9RHOB|nr:hypothetical protein RUA4292_00709 [Ruegeria atlantica]